MDENLDGEYLTNMLRKKFAERLRYAMAKRNIKSIDLAKALEVDKSQISCYRSGKYMPKQRGLFYLSEYLNVNVDWLLGSEVPMEKGDKSKIIKKVNVYSAVHCGILNEMIDNIVDIEEINVDNDKDYFGLKIKGDSMQPKYIEDDTIIVEKTSVITSGYDYVVSYNNEECFLKRIIVNENSTILQALNPIYPPIIVTENDNFKVIGKVVELRRKI